MINKQEQEAAIAKANEVNDHYDITHLTGNQPYKPANFILDSCKALGVGEVVIKESAIPYERSAVWSACIMKEGSTDIVLANGLNFCWQNYTVTKELFHILIDTEISRDMNLSRTTEFESLGEPFDSSKASYFPAAAELQAEIAAMEFLFPYKNRLLILEQAKPRDFMSIAMQYLIPRVMVEKYLSKTYLDELRDVSRQAA